MKMRQYTRVKVNVKAVVKLGGDEGRVFIAETENLSRGGACLRICENPGGILEFLSGNPLGMKVSLTLKERESSFEAYVTKTGWISSKLGWSLTPSEDNEVIYLGVAFEDLDEKEALKIEGFTLEFLQRRKDYILKKRMDGVLGGRKRPAPEKRREET